MTLPTTGNSISLGQIQTEFGGSNPASLNEYYAGAGYVGAGTVGYPGGSSTAIPSSGTISFSNFHGASAVSMQALFAYGYNGANQSKFNTVSTTGTVSSDTTCPGSAKNGTYGVGYGSDKGLYAYGWNSSWTRINVSNLVSNTGVIASDTSGVGGLCSGRAQCRYGSGKAIYCYGWSNTYGSYSKQVNDVSNTGVISSDTTGADLGRMDAAAAPYGTDKGVVAYGSDTSSSTSNKFNLITNTGTFGSSTTGAGTGRLGLGGAGYGNDKGCFYCGQNGQTTYYTTTAFNLVSNTGTIASNSSSNGPGRVYLSGTVYGGDKAIFGFGEWYFYQSYYEQTVNLVSNTGVIASSVTTSATKRSNVGACSFG